MLPTTTAGHWALNPVAAFDSVLLPVKPAVGVYTTVDSAALLKGRRELQIRHGADTYRLRLTATDISGEALAVARTNALRAGVGARISLLHGDLAEPLVSSRAPGDPPHLDLLIANLPYVPSDELDAVRDAARASASFTARFNEADGVGTPRDLSRIAIAAEPRIALDGGADGLDLIRRLIAELPRLLRPGGVAILEFGDGQGDAIARLADGLGLGWRAALRSDLSGRARIVEIRRGG